MHFYEMFGNGRACNNYINTTNKCTYCMYRYLSISSKYSIWHSYIFLIKNSKYNMISYYKKLYFLDFFLWNEGLSNSNQRQCQKVNGIAVSKRALTFLSEVHGNRRKHLRGRNAEGWPSSAVPRKSSGCRKKCRLCLEFTNTNRFECFSVLAEAQEVVVITVRGLSARGVVQVWK